MKNMFDADNKFNMLLAKLGDLIVLNIIFCVTCIPIFTIGAAVTAMYEITLKMAKNQEAYIVKSYFKSMKSNFKKATKAGLLAEIIGLILAVDLWIVMPNSGNVWIGVSIALLIVSFVFVMIISYFFPILAKFEDSMKNILKSSIFMAMGFLPVTLGVVILNCAGLLVFLCMGNYEVIFYILAVYCTVGFALTAFLNSIMLVNVFEKFYK
ncbi:MAG: DUF624 domain-containing protein [Eubacteriales bacterium]